MSTLSSITVVVLVIHAANVGMMSEGDEMRSSTVRHGIINVGIVLTCAIVGMSLEFVFNSCGPVFSAGIICGYGLRYYGEKFVKKR